MIDPEILKIKPEKVRLIGTDGKQLGVFNLDEAEAIAARENLDLILVNAKENSFVVKLGNYKYFLYQKEKKKKSKKKTKETKEIRISFNEALHDLQRKVKLTKEFLEEGHQVQIRLILKGREKNFLTMAEEKLNNFLNLIKEEIKFDLAFSIKKTANFLLAILRK